MMLGIRQEYEAQIKELKALIEEQKQQLLSEKKTCEWFYDNGWDDGNGNFYRFEKWWQLHISSMPEDIKKRRSQKK